MTLPVNIKALRKKYAATTGTVRDWTEMALQRSAENVLPEGLEPLGRMSREALVHAQLAQTYGEAGNHGEAAAAHEKARDLHEAVAEHRGEITPVKAVRYWHREAADYHREAAGRHRVMEAQDVAERLGFPGLHPELRDPPHGTSRLRGTFPGTANRKRDHAHLEQMADFLENHGNGEHSRHAVAIREHLHRDE